MALESSGSDEVARIGGDHRADCSVVREHVDHVLYDAAVVEEALAPQLQA